MDKAGRGKGIEGWERDQVRASRGVFGKGKRVRTVGSQRDVSGHSV